jgi:hypothetical protein
MVWKALFSYCAEGTKRTICRPSASRLELQTPGAAAPEGERTENQEVGLPWLTGSTPASSGSEKTSSTAAVRDTPSKPGGGAIERRRGGPASRISAGIWLSLPSGPTRVPATAANWSPLLLRTLIW